jgi:ABC-type transport system substrate-binding protein
MLGLIFGARVFLEGASEKPKRGGTPTVGILKDLSLMNPLVKTNSMDKRIRGLMFEPLLGIDRSGNIQPNLAESWKVSEDRKVYTFKLRQGVRFHNGQEMTAEDVKFAMDYTLNPKNGAFGLSWLQEVERVEAAERHTLRVYLKRASMAFLSSLTDIKTFSVIPKGSLPEGMSKLDSYPPGTGPFRFADWQPQQRILLERHEGYWGNKPYVDKLVLRPIKDDGVRFTALRAQDIDMAEQPPFEWAKQIADGRLKGIKLAMATFGGFYRLTFNVARPPFDDGRMRSAVAHAIDRRELLHAAFLGFGEPSDQNYPKGYAWYHEGVPTPAYNLDKAKALLKEAGYKGEPIDILVDQEVPNQTLATTLQAQMKRIGMNIRLDVLEYGAYTARHRAGDFALGFSGGSPKVDPSATYGPHLRCEPDLKKRASNTSGYCDKEMEALLQKAETELDPGKRKTLFKQIETQVARDLPFIYIGFTPDFIIYRDTVKGFTTDHDGSLQWWGGGLSHAWLDK